MLTDDGPRRTTDGTFGSEADGTDDPRLLAIAQECLAKLDRGERVQPEEFFALHPDLEDAIRTCIEGLQLVHRNFRSSRPLTQSTGVPTESLAADSPISKEPLGDFRILRELGRGGMGVVYEAVQISLGRRVALKVLPFAATLQPRQLQRFLNEAQAAAHLHHPQIVPVFAVGSDRGVHYYAMQLIDGLSLSELLVSLQREHSVSPETPNHRESSPEAPFNPGPLDHAASSAILGGETPVSPAISPPRVSTTMAAFSAHLSTQQAGGRRDYFRTIARFALQAAEALSYAHELGIVHRDIKPANLMVDARGNLWVTDFGLAMVRTGSTLTQSGDVLGTFRYMSPEQARGNPAALDHRTDIYSLGATLYELATFRPLFAIGPPALMVHRVIHEEPRTPRSIARGLPIELETIILKAINKSAADRYQSAQALADDLRRFLNDQPILAQRPNWLDYLRKWGRRNPAFLTCTILALVVTTIGLLIHNRMIAEEQGRTRQALARETTRSREAERSFQQARQAVDLLVQIGEEELSDRPPFQSARARLMTAAVAYYQQFIAEHSGDKAIQQELVSAEQRVQKILRELRLVRSFFRGSLLTDPEVQTDLQLTETQRESLSGILENAVEGIFLPTTTATTAADEVSTSSPFLKMAELQTARLAEILTTAQLHRLHQIWLQTQGVFAFQDSDVIEALMLTSEQRRDLQLIEFKLIFDRPAQSTESRGNVPNNPMENPDRMRAAVATFVAGLSPTQASIWKELIGRPFHGRSGPVIPIFPGGPPKFMQDWIRAGINAERKP